MGFLDKIKGIKKEKKEESKYVSNIESFSVFANNHVKIIADACAECYDVNKNKTYDEQLTYIKRRIATGHESILEHSNIVTLYVVSDKDFKDLIEVLEVCKFLNVKTKYKDHKFVVLIGGSVRGYKHIFRNIDNMNNKLLAAIKTEMYMIESCYFGDFIKDGIMDEEFFTYEPEHGKLNEVYSSDSLDTTNIDDINVLSGKLDELGFGSLFTFNDLLDMVTITFHIKQLARIISQQCTRHRVGITQLSQRYVNYSSGQEFHGPWEANPDKYSKDQKYEIELMGNKYQFTQDELGALIISIYPQMIKQGMLKQDARAFLPNNVNTSLYMTFTYRQFFHFISLRDSAHAQPEIQVLAREEFKSCQDSKISCADVFDKENFKYLKPRYELAREEAEANVEELEEIVEYIDEDK